MSITTGFTIVLILLFIVYMSYRLFLRRKLAVLVSLILQICIFTIAAVSYFNKVKTTEYIEGIYILAGILIPGSFFIYDYYKMISKVRKKGSYNGFIEPVPRFTSVDSLIDFGEIKNHINPLQSDLQPLDLISTLVLDNAALVKNLKKTLSEAQTFIKNRDFNSANHIYSTITSLIKNSPGLYYNYGNSCYTCSNYIEAAKSYEKALDANKKLQQELIEEGFAADEPTTDNYKNKSLKIDLNSKLFYNLGNTLFKLDKFDQAIDAYKKALELGPELEEAKENISKAMIAQGNFSEALDFYKSLMGNGSINYKNYYILGKLYFETRAFEDAEKSINECLKVSPSCEEALELLGQIFTIEEKHDKAISIYEKLISINPGNYLNQYNLGTSYLKTGIIEKSIEAFKQSLKINPSFYRSYFNMAIALEELALKDEAATSYYKAIGIKEDFVDAYNNLGILLSGLKKYNEALKVYSLGLERNPKEYSLYFNLGITLFEVGRYRDAIDAYKQALDLNQDENLLFYYIASAYTELKQYNKALEYYKKALKVLPADSEIFYNIATVYSLLRKYDIALDNLKTAIELNTDLKIDARFNGAFKSLRYRQEFKELVS